jgi:hypothetical protein
MGRYPKNSTPRLTSELIEKLASTIMKGAYVETAVALHSISKNTFYRWLRQAKSDNPTALCQELSHAVEKAMAEAELRDMEVIDQAAQSGQWQAAAWRLERKHPDRWGRRDRFQLEHTGPGGGAILVDERRVSLQKILADPGALAAIELLESKLEVKDQDEEG